MRDRGGTTASISTTFSMLSRPAFGPSTPTTSSLSAATNAFMSSGPASMTSRSPAPIGSRRATPKPLRPSRMTPTTTASPFPENA